MTSPSHLPPESLLQRLKRETAAQHAEVEASLDRTLRLTRPDVALDDYVCFLSRMLGVYRPLERALSDVDGLSASVSDMHLRWKRALLEADLEALGTKAEQRACIPESPLPAFAAGNGGSPLPESLGCLYVLEGSTLGGTFIHRHLTRVLGARVDGACRFLRPYGEETGRMWKAFGQSLTAAASRLQTDARVVDGAVQTFALMTSWFAAARPPSSSEGTRGRPAGGAP